MKLQRRVLSTFVVLTLIGLHGELSAQAAPPAPAPPAEQPAAPPTTAPAPTPSVAPVPAPAPAPAPVAVPAQPEQPPPPAAAAAPAPEPAATPAQPELAPPAVAPATDAPVHVAPEPAPPEPSHTPLGGPPVAVEGWERESSAGGHGERVYRGFSVRLAAQFGYASTTRDLDVGRTRTGGMSGGVSVDVGTAVVDDLIVYGRAGGFALNHASSSDSPNAGSAYFGLLGAGARYHFMPIDWYASGTLALAVTSTTNDLGVVENAKPGFGVQLETGKNWPSGPDAQWATVGLGLRFSYVRCGSLGDIDEPWVGLAFSLVFSIAYDWAAPAHGQ